MPSFSGRSSPPRLPFASGTRRRSRGCGRLYSTPISASTRAPSTRPCPCVLSISTRPRSRRSASGPGRERCWPISSISSRPAAPPQSASISCFPSPTACRPQTRSASGRNRRRSRLCARRSTSSRQTTRSLPRRSERRRLARFHRRAPRHLAPRGEVGLRSWRRRSQAVCTLYPGAASSLKELQDKAQGSGSLNSIPEHDQIIRRMPMVINVDDTLYPSFAGDVLGSLKGPRPTW